MIELFEFPIMLNSFNSSKRLNKRQISAEVFILVIQPTYNN